ncbi:MAG: ComEC/Rec2 family competence protein [Alphaproteobacteria bacterium]|nr:ComEC/Rec2 family competence protein [Alphaproteobacteria bacterium]
MRDWLDNQYQNLFLYVPFLLAGGVAAYFAINTEPNFILMTIIMTTAIAAVLYRWTPIICRAILIPIIGFCWAGVFTGIIDTPQMKRNIFDVNLVGTVQNIDHTYDKSRIYIKLNADDINADSGTAIIRVSVKDNLSMPKIGDVVRINGGLFKPARAYAPETFDYARWAYFNGITATGYANDLTILEHAGDGNINSLRQFLHDKSDSFLADTLVLGYKSSIPKTDNEIWTASGIGHVWSISGFHMTLVGGWLFAIFYLIFRSIPYVVRRIPAKIPAMGCAWMGLMFYLFLSGVDVATVRAFIMTSLIFLAFMVGRSAISLRNIAIAFVIIFAINPHYVMQAGFQLSFAAVFGLVWLYSVVKPKMPQNKLAKIIYACVLTSIVATIFTLPFVAMHFGKIQIYGLIGNLILLPVFSFIIMPLVMVGVAAAVVGIHTPLIWADNVYNHALGIAKYIADLPYANISVPHIPNIAIGFIIVGFMCLVLVRTIKLKINVILCVASVTVGTVIIYTNPKPIFLATYDNELVAFLGDDGLLSFNKSRASNHYFAFDTWKQLVGQNTNTPNKRRKHENGLYKYGDIVYVQKFMPLMKNINQLCNDDSVRYIVSYFHIKSDYCQHKILDGGFVIYPDGRVRYTQSNRRWQ